MNRIIIFLLFLIVLNTTTKVAAMSNSELNVIPTPQSISITEGEFLIRNDLKMFLPENPKLETVSKELSTSFKEFLGFKISFTKEKDSADIKFIIRDLDSPYKIPISKKEEAYRIIITSEKIEVTASTDMGLFYGAMTLIQLAEHSVNNNITNCEIIDWPDLDIRGVSDDISRGQVSTPENFKRIIRFIARYKMNTYMPYLEDMLQFDSYPSIGEKRGALSKTEVKELIAFADKYFIEIIPIFQTLGHYENLLAMDEFKDFAEFPGAASLCVSDEKVYNFLEILLKEVFDLFPSEYFHMGADESFDVGLGRSKHLVEQFGLAGVHAQHYKRVYDICKNYNKKVMMYGDIILRHPEILENIPKDITIVDWHYGVDFKYPSAEKFKESGFNFIVSPSVWNFVSTYPVYMNSVPNIKYITDSGIKNNTLGMINSNWGDYGAETIKELIFPGYAWSAQCAWNLSESEIGDFNRLFFEDFFLAGNNSAELLHESFSNQFNQITWNDAFRHPLLAFREPVWWEPRLKPAARYELISSSLQIQNKLLQDLKLKARRNLEYINILDFLTQFNKWYLLKIDTQVKLTEVLNGNEISTDLASFIDDNIFELSGLKEKHKNIWITYYKPDNLSMIMDKFDRLITYFTEIKADLSAGKLTSPEISSSWIYCPLDTSSFVRKAEFKKSFKINGKINSAALQLIGDSFVKLYINDIYVDQVFVRRSLSLLTEYKRIKYLDITNYLNAGENHIKVVAENFGSTSSAGFNLISKIKTENEDIFIQSDETWLTKQLENKDAAWIGAKLKPYRFDVIAPNFNTKRASWIER